MLSIPLATLVPSIPQMLSGNVSLNVAWNRSVSGAAPAVDAADAKRSAPMSAMRAQSLRMPNSLLPLNSACPQRLPELLAPPSVEDRVMSDNPDQERGRALQFAQ